MSEEELEYFLYGGKPPHENRDTSEEAANRIKPTVAKLALRIHNFIQRMGGATCWEVERDLKLKHQTVSARICELELLGLVEDSDERRFTDSGRKAIVWVAR